MVEENIRMNIVSKFTISSKCRVKLNFSSLENYFKNRFRYHSLRNDGSRFVRVGNIFSGLYLKIQTHSENQVLEQIRKGWLKDLVDSRKHPEPG